MKVLLLEHPRGRSSRHFNDVAHTPLSSSLISGYIFSFLRNRGIETELADCYRTNRSLAGMEKTVRESGCDLVGVHLVYSWENTGGVLTALNEMGLRTEVPIVVYGFYPTFACRTLLQACPALSYVIRGEPEVTFFRLCSVLRGGGDPEGVPGLAFRRNGAVVVNGQPEPINDLDALPFPHRTDALLPGETPTLLGSRGCYGNCRFCCINNFYGLKQSWRGRSPANIFEEVATLSDHSLIPAIYFADANFFGPGRSGQERGIKIARLLKKIRGLTFGMECRVNDIHEVSLRHLVEAGLRSVFLGVESASPRCLKRMGKGTTVGQAVRALSLLRRHGIEPHIGFIMFDADSDLRDIRVNFNFLQSQGLLSDLSKTVDLLYHPEIVLGGTDSYRELQSAGRLKLSSPGDYQGGYGFRDSRVQYLSECIAPLCHHLLELMDREDSPLYWRKGSSSPSNAAGDLLSVLNSWLVERFGHLLAQLEANEVPRTAGYRERFLINGIETAAAMMRSEQTVQSPAGRGDPRAQS